MAFSEPDQARIFDRMGHPRRFLSVDSALLQAIAAVGNDASMSARIVTYLDDCDRIDAKLKGSQVRQAVSSIDKNDIVLSGYREIVALRSEGRRYVGRIAAILGVEPRHDSFSAEICPDIQPTSPLQALYQGHGNSLMKLG